MVQLLLDYRHLARTRIVSMSREGRVVSVTFEVSSRLAPRYRTYVSILEQNEGTPRHEAQRDAWLDVLSTNIEDIRSFVKESASMPAVDEDLDLFPLGPQDEVDTIDTALIDGYIDGNLIEPGTVTSDHVRSLDAQKLTGVIHPDRLRDTGLTFDMLRGKLRGDQICEDALHEGHIRSVSAACVVGELVNAYLPDRSVYDSNIVSVSWDKVLGPVPMHIVKELDIARFSGQVTLDQLPALIPLEKIDTTQGLDLSLFTHGCLHPTAIGDRSIEAHHIDCIDADSLVGEIDGRILQPGSVLPSALTSVEGCKITGDIVNVDVVSVNTIDAMERLQSRTVVAEDVEATSTTTHTLLVLDTAEVSSRVKCASLEVSSEASADKISCDEVRCGRVDAHNMQCEQITAESLNVGHLASLTCELSDINAQSLKTDIIVSRDIQGDRIRCDYVDTDHTSCSSLQALNIGTDELQTHTLDVKASANVSGAISCAHASISNELSAESAAVQDLSAEAVACTDLQTQTLQADSISTNNIQTHTAHTSTLHVQGSIDSHSATIETSITSQSAHLAEAKATDLHAQQLDAVDVHVSHSVSVTGKLDAQDIVCNTAVSHSDMVVGLLCASQTNTDSVRSESVSASHLACDSLVTERAHTHTAECKQLECENLSTSRIKASNISCTSLTTLQTQGQEISGDSLTLANQLRTHSLSVSNQLEATQDVIIGGISISDALLDMERKLDSFVTSSSVGKPLKFERVVYYADTQYTDGHDKVEVSSPAFPDNAISLAFTVPSHGLVLSPDGFVSGTGDAAGVFPIATAARTVSGQETHILERALEFHIIGPPIWITPIGLDVVQRTPFNISLEANGATSYQDDAPALNGVQMTSSAFVGTLVVPGVFPKGAVAITYLERNQHVLTTPRDFQITVHPQQPSIQVSIGPVLNIAGLDAVLDTVLANDPDTSTFVSIFEKQPYPAAVEWVTDSVILLQVGTLNISLQARGAQSYSVASRETLPVFVNLNTNTGALEGTVSTPRQFSFTARAMGPSRLLGREPEKGGHLDRTFNVTVRPFGIDFGTFAEPNPIFPLQAGRPVSYSLVGTLESGLALNVVS